MAVDVLVFQDRIEQRFARRADFWAILQRAQRLLAIETMKSLPDVPSVIATLDDDVQLFIHRLADVARKQFMTAAAVEGNPPGVAHSVGEDFRAALLSVRERVVRRNCVWTPLVHVDAENLSEERRGVLAVALWRMTAPFVVGIAAVAHGEVEKTVWSEGDATGVVIEPGLVDLEQHALRGWVKTRAVVFDDFEFRQTQRV